MPEISDEIYKMIIDNLHITYTPDESTERRLKNEIADGISFIREHCDPEADCAPGTKFAGMLCDYVLRAESGAKETFAQDFAEDITGAKIGYDTRKYAEVMGYDQE